MKKLFGRDFIQVTNDDDLSSLQKKTNSLFGKLMTWSTSFPNNKKSSIWKQRQVLTKKNYTAIRGFALKEEKE